MDSLFWTASFYTIRYCSSTSLWFAYHTLTGTYETIKYIRKICKPEKAFILFERSPEPCLLKDEIDYQLIMTEETLMNDMINLHEQLYEIKHDLREERAREIELSERHKKNYIKDDDGNDL